MRTMLKLLTQNSVDIYQLPGVDKTHECMEGSQLTIGDLHGNAIKLLFILIHHGIASGIDDQDYAQLVEIYHAELSKDDLEKFNQILDKLSVHTGATVRFVGDELADRGSNDYFTLKILEKLHSNQVQVEILLSNHSIEFIRCYEQNTAFESIDMPDHSISMKNLAVLIRQRLVSRQEILHIINRVYKPALKALSYSLNPSNSEITIYSHAPIGLNNIQALAKLFNVPYREGTTLQLAETIEAINFQVKRHVYDHKLYQKFNVLLQEGNPLYFLLWNRNYTQIHRPFMHAKYFVNFVHGHDISGPTENHIFNLDNQLGKASDLYWGEYKALFSHGHGPKPSDENESVSTLPVSTSHATSPREEQVFQALNLVLNNADPDTRLAKLNTLISRLTQLKFTKWMDVFQTNSIQLWLADDEESTQVKKTLILLELQEILWTRKDFIGLIPIDHHFYPTPLLIKAAIQLLRLAATDCSDINNNQAMTRAKIRISAVAFLPHTHYLELFSHEDLAGWKTQLNPAVAEVLGLLYSYLDIQYGHGFLSKKNLISTFLSSEQSKEMVEAFWTVEVSLSRSDFPPYVDIEGFLLNLNSNPIEINLWNFLRLLNNIAVRARFIRDDKCALLFPDPRFNIGKIIESPALFNAIYKTMTYMNERALGVSPRAADYTYQSYDQYTKRAGQAQVVRSSGLQSSPSVLSIFAESQKTDVQEVPGLTQKMT